MNDALNYLQEKNILARIWNRDHTVWKSDPMKINNRLGWLGDHKALLIADRRIFRFEFSGNIADGILSLAEMIWMISALVFDLDGTLVQTEILKTLSYARAVADLTSGKFNEKQVIDAYQTMVGRSRRQVATKLMADFDLENAARKKMALYGVRTPWQAFVQVRLTYYDKLLDDANNVINNRCFHSIELLSWARLRGFQTGLATMSSCKGATQILDILELGSKFDFIATRDDVDNGKPDPEIYNLIRDELGIAATEGLAIEDSPSGIQAALNAGLACIAVTNQFTRRSVHTCQLLKEKWIVDKPADLRKTVEAFLSDSAKVEVS